MSQLPVITSRRHPLIAACRDARAGGDDQPLLLDGWHLVVEATHSPLAVDAVLLGHDPPGAAERAAIAALVERGAQVVRVTADVMHAASPVRTPSGVVALARRRVVDLDAVIGGGPALVAVLVDVQDPGNVGAVVRTAEAAGATGVVAAGISADPFGWKALRASMGSAFRLPVARLTDRHAIIGELRARGLALVALAPLDGQPPDALDLTAPTALLLGGEGGGLPDPIVAGADVRLRLPMRPPVESLNVAVAGALALYAAMAQRQGRP
ncbi:MAG: TrmH family RNA methyltransferase [Vicinamibacterales bacterium]